MIRRPYPTAAVVLLLAVLSACTQPTQMSERVPPPDDGHLNRQGYLDRPEAYQGAHIYNAPAGTHVECVAYARERTGLEISGNAWTWWRSAAAGYLRTNTPNPMSVLVLRRTGKLPQGHVAVVRSVVGPREIRVDHANWDDRRTRGRIYEDMSAIDVSPRNDWTAVRFWNGADYGRPYAAYGFIDKPGTPGTTRQASR